MAIKKISLQNKNFDISYSIFNAHYQNTPNTKVLVFLHGWGSNKELMSNAFSPYHKNYKHIYMDLAGFGNSTNDYVIDTFFYAKLISAFLDKTLNKNDNICAVIGHSFGGKIATLLNPPKLILLSSAGIIEPQSFIVKTKIILSKIFGFLKLSYLSKFLRSADGYKLKENMYGVLKLVIKENFDDIFKNTKSNTLILWGENDLATSYKSGEKISQLIKKNIFYSFNGGHFFFLYKQNIKQVNKKIKDFIT